MQEKDAATKDFLNQPEIFADLFNGTFFHGENIIQKDHLIPENTELQIRPKDSNGNKFTLRKYRDISMKEQQEFFCRILACEHQSEVHYLMPLRTMIYDELSYEQQMKIIQQNRKRKLHGAEFLSTFNPVKNFLRY